MKRYIQLLLMLSLCIPALAQHIGEGPLHSADSPRKGWLLPGDTIYSDGGKQVYSGEAREISADESNVSRLLTDRFYGRDLHQGLNVGIGASAFITSGKHVPHRGGFTQSLDIAWLSPLTRDRKLWLSAGGYVNNVMWGSDNLHDAGLSAVLGYTFNEHWEAYVYGKLTLANNYKHFGYYSPYYYGAFAPMGYSPLYGSNWYDGGANVLGAGVRYNVNQNLSFQVNVQGVWYPKSDFTYFDQFNYPVPKVE